MLPLGIEVHEAFDVYEDRAPVPVHQNMVWSQLSVDEPVLRTRTHGGRQFTKDLPEAVTGGAGPRVAGGYFGEVFERTIENDLFAGPARGDTTTVDQGHLSKAGPVCRPHHPERLGEPCQDRFDTPRVES